MVHTRIFRGSRLTRIYWRYSLNAVCAFVDAANINQLLGDNGATGDIGLLSIDIDGNDYWVWRAIEVVSPRIVVCEFNGIFGSKAKVSVPYDPAFERGRAHYSFLLAGASLSALAHLGVQKGYRLVGINSAGNNAFLVRQDVARILADARSRVRLPATEVQGSPSPRRQSGATRYCASPRPDRRRRSGRRCYRSSNPCPGPRALACRSGCSRTLSS